MEPLQPAALADLAQARRVRETRLSRSAKRDLKAAPTPSPEEVEAALSLFSFLASWRERARHLENQWVLQCQRKIGGVPFTPPKTATERPRPLVPPHSPEVAAELVQHPGRVLSPYEHLEHMTTQIDVFRDQISVLEKSTGIARSLLNASKEVIQNLDRQISCLQRNLYGNDIGLNAMFSEHSANENHFDETSTLSKPIVHVDQDDADVRFDAPTDTEALSITL